MIFRWLPKRELTRCAFVCRRFRRVACDEGLWTRVDLGCKTISFFSLACVVQRGVRILRLAQAEVSHVTVKVLSVKPADGWVFRPSPEVCCNSLGLLRLGFGSKYRYEIDFVSD